MCREANETDGDEFSYLSRLSCRIRGNCASNRRKGDVYRLPILQYRSSLRSDGRNRRRPSLAIDGVSRKSQDPLSKAVHHGGKTMGSRSSPICWTRPNRHDRQPGYAPKQHPCSTTTNRHLHMFAAVTNVQSRSETPDGWFWICVSSKARFATINDRRRWTSFSKAVPEQGRAGIRLGLLTPTRRWLLVDARWSGPSPPAGVRCH